MLRSIKHKLSMWLMKLVMGLAPSATHQLFAGAGSSRQLGLQMARAGLRRVLVVTDKPLVELGIAEQAVAGLRESGVELFIYDGVLPNPTYEVVEEGRALYVEKLCDGILAVGGGSSIDAAKIIGLAVCDVGAPQDFVGLGKVRDPIPPFYAIPTTAGTGSEATMGAVISDTVTHEKSVISGAPLLPNAACLDPELMQGMPPSITAATGMDAMTHAIEAYIGILDIGDCKDKAMMAVRLLFKHLPVAYADGSNLEARDAVAHASYMAGQAINQVNVGNVHAIAHQVGGKYGLPHGVCNAVILPYVLELSKTSCASQLMDLAAEVGLNSVDEFIAAIRQMNANLGLPTALDALDARDFSALVARAVDESNGYPVPYLMNDAEVTGILRQLLPTGA